MAFVPKKNLFLRQIGLFGETENGIVPMPVSKDFTNVSLWLGRAESTRYAANGRPMEWNHATNSYLTEGAEFLKGRLCRLNGKTATLTFEAPAGNYIFYFRLYPFEPNDGANVLIRQNGETLCSFALDGREDFYSAALPSGFTELVFSASAKATVQYEFFAHRKLSQ